MMSQGGRASGTLASALLVAGAVTPAESDRDWSTFHAGFLQFRVWSSIAFDGTDGEQRGESNVRLAYTPGALRFVQL
jgi:hypothetical protein